MYMSSAQHATPARLPRRGPGMAAGAYAQLVAFVSFVSLFR